MKFYTLAITLLVTVSFSFSTFAKVDVVPLDMEFGYWESKSEVLGNDMMDALLAQMSPEQQAQIRAVVQSSMQSQIAKQCFSKETFENFEAEFKKAVGGKSDCSMDIQKSTKKELVGNLKCDGRDMKLTTKVVNSKLIESMLTGTDNTKIKVLSRFISKACPTISAK